jgi:hypothetical protein
MSKTTELQLEQAHVDRCYARLAELRARVEGWRQETLGQGGAGTYANRFERDRLVDALTARAGEFDVGGEALCFGRLDLAEGDTFHLGRVSVADEAGDPLVVDWRAPIAGAFYRATPLVPLGVVRRRHLLCRGPQVVGVDDDLLDPDAVVGELELVGEAALLQALGRKRTGRMSDIVATIQADQDRAVRAPLAGALIVEGGPGTGKTAVALHRAAYLLYAERVLLEEQGILVVGPSPAFCRYVSQVLPSLGEEGVALATIADLAPVAVRAGELVDEPEAVGRLKGGGRMAGFLAAAVRTRQRVLKDVVEVPHGAYVLRLTPDATRRIVRSARTLGVTHNQARAYVERLVVAALWKDWQAARGRAARRGLRVDGAVVDDAFEAELADLGIDEDGDDPADADDATDGPDPDDGAAPTPEFVDAVRSRRELRRALDRVWPVLGPDDLLRDLYGSPALLRAAARRSEVSESEAASLHRPRPSAGEALAWSEADLPLLDEATVLLGPVPKRGRASGVDPIEAMLAEQMVERVMEDVEGSGGPLTGLDAELTHALQERVRATALGASRGDVAPSAEPRTYGHVVVDEAQELSTMAWRMLRRRCPRRSFTIVGDLDQAGAPGAARSWDEVFDALDHPAGTVVRFNVNYRTPGPVMALAAAVVGSDVRSAREGGDPARIVDAGDDIAATVLAEVERLEAADPGQVAVVAPAALVPAVAERLGVPAATADIGGVRRIVLDPRRAKGLEFDSVVVVDPAAIAAAGGSGRRDLYVSLTRTTDRLTIVGPLPSA